MPYMEYLIVFGARDGSHILIIVLAKDHVSYYCWEGFYFAFLQGYYMQNVNAWIMILSG